MTVSQRAECSGGGVNGRSHLLLSLLDFHMVLPDGMVFLIFDFTFTGTLYKLWAQNSPGEAKL